VATIKCCILNDQKTPVLVHIEKIRLRLKKRRRTRVRTADLEAEKRNCEFNKYPENSQA